MIKRAAKIAYGVNKKVQAIFRQRDDLAAKPATNDQLARIWPPWNALPDDMLPEEKSWILTFDEREQPHPDPKLSTQAKRLRKRFSFLPLNSQEYRQAFNRVCQWARLTNFFKSTVDLHQALVTRQWAFAEADNQASGRVAIFRAANELRLARPGFLELAAPVLTDIALLEARYAAYTAAREQALAALSELIFKIPGLRTGKPLPLAERALGIPHPPNDVPRHLFLARLDALGICSNERLSTFLRDELPNLGRLKRAEFYAMSLKTRHGKEPYAALLVWLLENRPIFEHAQYGWQWGDIQNAAGEKGIDCPRTSFKQWSSRHGLALGVKRGPATSDASRITPSMSLLSPAPVFGDILKAVST